jgi:hypothetical protein
MRDTMRDEIVFMGLLLEKSSFYYVSPTSVLSAARHCREEGTAIIDGSP